MKKKLSYRDKLLELSRIYGVKEIQDYIKNKKNLTSGQIELILRKNKIIIPKDFKTSFFKENFSKPLSKVSRQIDDFKEGSTKAVSRASRKITYFKEDSSRSVSSFFLSLWKSIGNVGLSFLNVFPKLGTTIYNFIGNLLVDLFHGIYSNQIQKAKVGGRVVITFFIVIGIITVISSGIATFKNL